MSEVMEKYLGVKLIEARPMTAIEYNETVMSLIYTGYCQDGYFIKYEDGYVSWLPKEVFEKAYRRIDNLTFGLAIEALKQGKKVSRAGWNGKGMWIALMPSLYLPPNSTQTPGAKVNDRTAKHIGVDAPLDSQPYIAMWTAEKKWQPGWLASQADILAEDWLIIK